MKTRIMITLTALLIGVAASAKDLRTVVFYVKDMHCENCEKKVKENIRFEKGLKSLSTDVDSRTVTITYDADKTSVEDLQAGFAKFNYTAEVVSNESATDSKSGKTDQGSKSDKSSGANQSDKSAAASQSSDKSSGANPTDKPSDANQPDKPSGTNQSSTQSGSQSTSQQGTQSGTKTGSQEQAGQPTQKK